MSDAADSALLVHPMLAESAVQFQAQAYKEMLPAGGPVKTQIVGDVTSESEDQAQRVQDFMNYQITYAMKDFDPELDQLLFYLPLASLTRGDSSQYGKERDHRASLDTG